MARADLLCELIKAGLRKDDMTFRRATQAICAEERTKQHEILANKIEQLLKENPEQTISTPRNTNMHTINSINSIPKHLFEEKMPEKRLEQLLLPDNVVETCRAIIEEQMRADLLRSYGLEPRNKILLIGPPGNGKTSLAEAIAEALMVPLITVRYDTIIGAYLGETASRLSKLFEYASTRQCVLFFDEFDTIGKERGDQHETGEIKRVVSSLLLQIDSLVNTDYFLPCGVVIKKEDDKLVIENPGSIRTGKKQMLRGGISDPRNKTLMKMFNMIGIGERAGSGIPDIYQVWENEGWPMPVVEESYNPDRTRLSLEFAKKQTIKTSEEEKEPKRSQKGAEKEPIKGAERKKEILKLIKVNSTITQVEIMKELDLTRKQVQKDMKELQEMHIIAREGTNRRGRWIIVKENK